MLTNEKEPAPPAQPEESASSPAEERQLPADSPSEPAPEQAGNKNRTILIPENPWYPRG